MSYTKHTWESGELVTAAKLNTIEAGLASAASIADTAKTTATTANGKLVLQNAEKLVATITETPTSTYDSLRFALPVSSGGYRLLQLMNEGVLGLYTREEGEETFTAIWRIPVKNLAEVKSNTTTISSMSFNAGGYITGSGKNLRFEIPSLNTRNFTSITITGMSLYAFYESSAFMKDTPVFVNGASVSGYNCTFGSSVLGTFVTVAKDDAYITGVNDAACGILANLSFTATYDSVSVINSGL